ncbi:MAG TPA: ABATE domain-containing protein [Streptosporangiaceae bacterium]|nr:ABATE domain-containing protein [Streptosporangiaceae bacterium]
MDGVDTVGLGDHPALDFLNSIATPVRDPVELLTGGPAYLAWLARAGFIDTADRAEIEARFGPADLAGAAAQAIQLREWLRPLVAAWATSPAPALPASARGHLNGILAADHRFPQIEVDRDGRPAVAERRSWDTPAQLLVPPAEAAAQLLTSGDRELVRPCEGPTCTLWFYDRTRSHRRRWCSMATCGNRAKARNHRQREHQGGDRA